MIQISIAANIFFLEVGILASISGNTDSELGVQICT